MGLKIVCMILLLTFAAASASLMTLQMTNIEEEPQSVSLSVIPSFLPTGDPIPLGDPIRDPNPPP